MAKLNSYGLLCPLINHQTLLGVENDPEPGAAIVTLGRNIIKRYKLNERKEISNWLSKKEHLTSPVVYYPTTKKYAAIFNEKFIRIWSENETLLENATKSKILNVNLHRILTLGDNEPVVINQNGETASLVWVLTNRKNWKNEGIFKPHEKIQDCQLLDVNGTTFMYAFTKLDQADYFNLVELEPNLNLTKRETLIRIELKNSFENLMGRVVAQDENNVYLLTLWSCGRLFSYTLLEKSSPGDPFPGTFVSTITSVSTKNPVVLLSLSETAICMYGSDVAEEGAVLAIYNIRFKLTQAIQNLKLYSQEAKLWKMDDKLLLTTNKHLAVVSFQLSLQRLEALMGSFVDTTNDSDDDVIIQENVSIIWEDEEKSPSKKKNPFSKLAKTIASRIQNDLEKGLDDSEIQEKLMADLIENKDIESILWCLENLRDLPEKVLIDLVIFGLRSPDQVFECKENGVAKKNEIPTSKKEFINIILNVPNTDMFLLDFLKSSMNFEDVVKLLEFLIGKVEDDEENFEANSTQLDKQFYEWLNLLIDSQYTNLVLSTSPEVFKLLKKLKNLLGDDLQVMKDLEDLRPMVRRVLDKKSLTIRVNSASNIYSIESIKLY